MISGRGHSDIVGCVPTVGLQSPRCGPVAQRPTGDGMKQARNRKGRKGLPTKLPPNADADRTGSTDATDPLALIVATLSQSQRQRLRALLDGDAAG